VSPACSERLRRRAAHLAYGLSVPSRSDSIRVVRTFGEDGLAIRTGQLRSTRPGRTRSRYCSRSTAKPSIYSVFEDRHLSMPRVADRPRLIGWSSLHPCTSPISDVLRRRCGHRLAGSRTDGKLARRTPCGVRLALTHSTETATTPALAERRVQRSERLPSCRNRRDFRHAAEARCLLVRRATCSTHRSRRWIGPPCASARVRLSLGQRPAVGSPCGSPSVVTRDASDRLLPSQFLRTSTRASSAPGWVARCSRVLLRGIAWFTPARFALVGRTYAPCRSIGHVWAFSSQSWSVRFSAPLTPLSPPPGFVAVLAHHPDPQRSPRPLCRARVKRDAQPKRSEVSSVVQGPLPCSALSSARLRTFPALRLGHRSAGSRRLFTRPPSPGMCEWARPPFTRTAANG
jgi:hypothetical protein